MLEHLVLSTDHGVSAFIRAIVQMLMDIVPDPSSLSPIFWLNNDSMSLKTEMCFPSVKQTRIGSVYYTSEPNRLS